MEDTRPDLSITIVSFNTKDLTRQTLQSIYDNTRSASFEIFVVDNASPDGSADMIEQEFPKVNVIRNDVNKGLAAATNQGLEKSAGRYVLALNSDVVVQPEAFDVLVHFMDEHPDAGGAIPKLVLPDGGAHPMFCGKAPTFKVEMMDALGALHSSIAEAVPTARVGMEIDISKTQEVPCILWGTSFIVRREVLETVGPQDPTFFVYSEDVDWSMRIAKAGWKQYYVSEACVIHYGGQSTKQAGAKMSVQLLKSKCRLVQKHYGLVNGYILRATFAFVCGIRMAKWIAIYMLRGKSRAESSARIQQMWKAICTVLTY